MKKNNRLEDSIFASFPLEPSRQAVITKASDGSAMTLTELNDYLDAVGVSILEKEDKIVLVLNASRYNKERTRNAGNRRKYSYENDTSLRSLKYYDILYWKYGLDLKWQEVMLRTRLSRATFFRHKKEMEESIYYRNFLKQFDPEAEHDLEYFKNIRELDQSF